jgi:hypothetical protein
MISFIFIKSRKENFHIEEEIHGASSSLEVQLKGDLKKKKEETFIVSLVMIN